VPDKSERSYLLGLPTSFNLAPEAVDRVRAAAHQVLTRSPEFQRLLRDLKEGHDFVKDSFPSAVCQIGNTSFQIFYEIIKGEIYYFL